MQTPEQLPRTETLQEHSEEVKSSAGRLEQSRANGVVAARVSQLRSLIGKVSPSRYESLTQKIEQEKKTLQRFVDRKERIQAVELERAQDLDDRYFVKKRLNHSII